MGFVKNDDERTNIAFHESRVGKGSFKLDDQVLRYLRQIFIECELGFSDI